MHVKNGSKDLQNTHKSAAELLDAHMPGPGVAWSSRNQLEPLPLPRTASALLKSMLPPKLHQCDERHHGWVRNTGWRRHTD